MAEIKKSV